MLSEPYLTKREADWASRQRLDLTARCPSSASLIRSVLTDRKRIRVPFFQIKVYSHKKVMTAQQIDIFRTIGPTMLPRLIDANELESIDDYGDYAILTYNLAKPVPIKDALDDMEDNMDLNILYHVESFSTTKRGDHCCAYSVPTSGRMYKLNAQSGADKMLETIYVYVFDSLEVMLEALKTDLAQHLTGGIVITKMEMSRLVADFM